MTTVAMPVFSKQNETVSIQIILLPCDTLLTTMKVSNFQEPNGILACLGFFFVMVVIIIIAVVAILLAICMLE